MKSPVSDIILIVFILQRSTKESLCIANIRWIHTLLTTPNHSAPFPLPELASELTGELACQFHLRKRCQLSAAANSHPSSALFLICRTCHEWSLIALHSVYPDIVLIQGQVTINFYLLTINRMGNAVTDNGTYAWDPYVHFQLPYPPTVPVDCNLCRTTSARAANRHIPGEGGTLRVEVEHLER